MNSFVLKMIGLLSMMIDHAGKLLFANEAWMMCLGRLAFPIFAYQTAMGYEKTRDLRQYAIRLAVFAMVSQVPYAIDGAKWYGAEYRLYIVVLGDGTVLL